MERKHEVLELVRLNSCGAKHAGHWITAIPDRQEYKINDAQYKTAVQIRLDVPLTALSSANKCACGYQLTHTKVDTHHMLTCLTVRKAATYQRHQSVAKALEAIAKQAGCRVTINPKMVERAGDHRQPDLQIDGSNVHIVTDVAITHPVRNSVTKLTGVATTEGIAAAERAKEKVSKYEGAFGGGNVSVHGFVLETYGAASKGVGSVLAAMGGHAEQLLGVDPLAFGVMSWHMMSVALQVGNGLLIREAVRRCTTRALAIAARP